MSAIRVRFAPSPTGLLHVGGARTALFNWLFARSQGGTFILRIEDTDEARNTEEANQAIFSGLQWLGLDWDEGPDRGGSAGPYRQSERQSLYDAYLEKLRAADLIYDDQGATRFRGGSVPRTVDDLICGETLFADRDEPDMTIRRPDGSYIFHFVSVVDDIEMGVTHVIRGEDHLSNTPRHLDLYEAFGATPPRFAHIPLILNPDGSKMSKRDRGASVAEYQESGFVSAAVVNYLALLGWSPKDDSEILSVDELLRRFQLDHVNRSNARFDYEKCRWLSGQYIGAMNPATIRESIAPFVTEAFPGADPALVPDAVLEELRQKIQTFSEATDWLRPLFVEEVAFDAETLDKLRQRPDAAAALGALETAFAALPAWDADTIHAAIADTASSLGVKQGALMFPCRVAVTGQSGGLGLMPILEFLGQGRSVARLLACADSVA